jgi:hypothetical protein
MKMRELNQLPESSNHHDKRFDGPVITYNCEVHNE